MKSSFKKHLWHLWGLIFYIVLCISLYFYLVYEHGEAIYELAMGISVICFFLLCVPCVFLYWRYIYLEKELKVEFLKNSINIFKGDLVRNIKLNEISYIDIKLPIPLYYNGFRYFATDSFLCATAHLNSGEQFVITSLVDLELIDTKNYFKNKIQVKERWAFICWPPSHRFNC